MDVCSNARLLFSDVALRCFPIADLRVESGCRERGSGPVHVVPRAPHVTSPAAAQSHLPLAGHEGEKGV